MTFTNIFIARQTEIVVQDLKNEVLIYDLQTNKAFCLNETSSLVYRLCNGNNSIAEIRRQISAILNQPVSEDFVWLAIEELKRNQLLIDVEKIETKFEGVSRREAIRRVGLASIVALPVIASLTAPNSADAASLVACQSCTNSLDLGTLCGLPNGCFSQTFIAGITTTGCTADCRICTCRIPGGERSCNSICTPTR